MNWEEVKKWLDENKNDDQVKAYMKENTEITKYDVAKLAVKNTEVKSWLDSEKDKHLQKGIETWKENNLEKIVDEEVKKRNPEKEPWEVEVEKLKQELEKEKNEKSRESLKNKALSVATEKGIPTALVDYLLGEDEETTIKNLEQFQEVVDKEYVDPRVQQEVDQRLSDGSYEPPTGGDDDGGTSESFIDVIKDQQVKR